MKKTKSSQDQFEVLVDVYFDEENSEADKERFIYIYSIKISNRTKEKAQLLRRKWLITNGDGESLIIRGDGVVGEQPIIEPNASYKYTSGVVLETEMGTMEGEYTMCSADGKEFKVPIKKFVLAAPRRLH